jgi:hypothetical protein
LRSLIAIINHATKPARRHRAMATTLLVAGGALAVGGLLSAAPGHAADAYVALSYSLESEVTNGTNPRNPLSN